MFSAFWASSVWQYQPYNIFFSIFTAYRIAAPAYFSPLFLAGDALKLLCHVLVTFTHMCSVCS